MFLNRFLFVLLGPPGKGKSYNEIGRAIATLMVDDVRMNIFYLMGYMDTDDVLPQKSELG